MSIPNPRLLTRKRGSNGKVIAEIITYNEDSKLVTKTPKDLPWKAGRTLATSSYFPHSSESDLGFVSDINKTSQKKSPSKYTSDFMYNEDFEKASDIQSEVVGEEYPIFAQREIMRSPSVTRSSYQASNRSGTPVRSRILTRTPSSKTPIASRTLLRGSSARSLTPSPVDLQRSPVRSPLVRSPTRSPLVSSPTRSPLVRNVDQTSPLSQRLTQSPRRTLVRSQSPSGLTSRKSSIESESVRAQMEDDIREDLAGLDDRDIIENEPDAANIYEEDAKLEEENEKIENEQSDNEAREGSVQLDREQNRDYDDEKEDSVVVAEESSSDDESSSSSSSSSEEELPSPPKSLRDNLPIRGFKDPLEKLYSEQGFKTLRTFELYQKGVLSKTVCLVQMITRYNDIIFVKFPKTVILGDDKYERVPLNTSDITIKCPSKQFRDLMWSSDVVTLFEGGLIYDSKIYSESQKDEIDTLAPYIYPLYHHSDDMNFENVAVDARDLSVYIWDNLVNELETRKDSLINNLKSLIDSVENHYDQLAKVDNHRSRETDKLIKFFNKNKRQGQFVFDPEIAHKGRHLSETMVRYMSSHLSLWCMLNTKVSDAVQSLEEVSPIIYRQFKLDYPELFSE
jgi:hypothetical protein